MSDPDDHPAHTALRDAASEILTPHGLVLEEIVVAGPRTRPEVRLVVDLPEDSLGSADLDTVTTASRELSARIDADDSLLGPDPVVLEITTPGVERELTAARHFRRSRGRLLDLTVADDTRYRARLLGLTAGDVLLLRQEPGRDDRGRPRRRPAGTPERLEIPRADIVSARVEIEFDPPADLAQLIADAESTASDPTATTKES
ncbi:ribosome maturation factor RimP [Brachybacterium fresconis]|uniref:Ribosome maturation factor RimP n=1 Tax=Brachybacterium fresconis TaxID=173363 RepID=A0ABS4YPQ5_9MICO|nr:ribosome assembly cofactor RimP [Brachybacterium fresconis]MBP2410771.1 ribosome maturation factor RimP [Brachybacterium fresconis]